jgi:hypothetical protein
VTTDLLVIGEIRGDYRDPAVRLSNLLDANLIVPLHESDDSGVLAVKGRIVGVKVLAYSTDARLMDGSMTARGCRRIVEAIDTSGRVERASDPSVVDEVIDPSETRRGVRGGGRGPRTSRKHPPVNRTEEPMRLANGRTR